MTVMMMMIMIIFTVKRQSLVQLECFKFLKGNIAASFHNNLGNKNGDLTKELQSGKTFQNISMKSAISVTPEERAETFLIP